MAVGDDDPADRFLKDWQQDLEPERLSGDDKRSWSRLEPFLDFATRFVAANGAWPMGKYYESDDQLKEALEDAYWNLPFFAYASELDPELEFADNPPVIPARLLILPLRRKLSRVIYYIEENSIPPLYVTSEEKLVWKKEDVVDLFTLANRTIRTADADVQKQVAQPVTKMHFPSRLPKDLYDSDDDKRAFIAANLGYLSPWQLKKIFAIVQNGREDELREIPVKAPTLWESRTKEQRINGKGFISPPAFLKAVWAPWLSRGLLTEDDIEARDPPLMEAYKRWLRSHKDDRIPELRPGPTKLQKRVYSITPQTSWDEVETIAMAVDQARKRRLRGPSQK